MGVSRMAELEKSTRALESDMAETWYAAQATSMMIRNTSSHPSVDMGVHFLCVDDMVSCWQFIYLACPDYEYI